MVTLTGGTKRTQDTYTGPANELTVDESNRDLRLHDGAKPGGHRILSVANSDSRYQPKSSELTGLGGFEPQEHGILVRLGPSEYALRGFAESDDFIIDNPAGFEGDFSLRLKLVIPGPHTWASAQTFQAVVTFDEGLIGDLKGNVLGNLQGNAHGDHTGTLTGDAFGDLSGTFTGAVDVMGHEFLYDQGFLGLDAIEGLGAYVGAAGVPTGGIILWSGVVANIPAGWKLCNGAAGTPDLRSRFVVGAGSDYAPAATGGANLVTPVGSTGAAGGHTHNVSGNTATSLTGASISSTIIRPEYEQNQVNVVGSVTLTDPGHAHTMNAQTTSAGDHSHSLTMQQQENRPAFYALCYIMKG